MSVSYATTPRVNDAFQASEDRGRPSLVRRVFPKPDAVSEADYRVYVLFSIVGHIGAPVHVVLIPYFALVGATWLAVLNVASAAAWLYSIRANRAGRHNVANLLVTIEVFTHSVACATTLGLSLGFQHYLWGGLTFIMLNNRLGRRSIVAITTGLMITFLLLSLLADSVEYTYGYPGTVPYVHSINVVIAFVATALTAYHFRTSSFDAERELEQLASTDVLTGLHNRRRLSEEIAARVALAEREELELSLVLVDVDSFKVVNDTLGHDVGDAVLAEVARRLAQRVRRSDVVGRWGGEEFLVLLHGPHANATTMAGELHDAIAEAPVSVAGHDLAVTVTIGGAHFGPNESIDSCVKRADLALYRGKDAGRNRVVFDTTLVAGH